MYVCDQLVKKSYEQTLCDWCTIKVNVSCTPVSGITDFIAEYGLFIVVEGFLCVNLLI